MNRRTWKKEEHRIAKELGTNRALGTDGKGDILHDIFLLDSKLRERWNVQRWFQELRKEADSKSKIPVLVCRQPRKHMRLAVMSFDNFVSLAKGAGFVSDDP